jgi:hypothetical protein
MMAKSKTEPDFAAAIQKLADAIDLLAGAHVAGVQSAMIVSAVTECTREAAHLAGAKDESDTRIDDGPQRSVRSKETQPTCPPVDTPAAVDKP